MKQNFRRYGTKTLAKLDDKFVEKLVVLGTNLPVLQRKLDALKSVNRKPKRAKEAVYSPKPYGKCRLNFNRSTGET
jgi:hypothetical protein